MKWLESLENGTRAEGGAAWRYLEGSVNGHVAVAVPSPSTSTTTYDHVDVNVDDF
ncbi:MAG TPA: hypothetical protein VMK66_02930 [Myxococcales bacterium]|nr:hypothetical protein [Myxococcales bacterium]